MSHTQSGAAFTDLVLQVFRVNGALLAAGNILCHGTGLTSARWQILGATALSEQSPTVAQIARTMGQSRQAVHRIVEEMERDKLLRRESDPQHKRALPIQLTTRGKQLYEEMTRRQIPWANEMSAGIGAATIADAMELLRTVGDRLEIPESRSAGPGSRASRQPLSRR